MFNREPKRVRTAASVIAGSLILLTAVAAAVTVWTRLDSNTGQPTPLSLTTPIDLRQIDETNVNFFAKHPRELVTKLSKSPSLPSQGSHRLLL